MKKILITICAIFIAGFARADTIDINWHNEDGTIYDTSTCTVGGDVILPTTPTKYGYTFAGWATRYIPIEYIESTGAQYINTRISQNTTLTSIKQYFGFAYSVLPNERQLSGFDASKDNYLGTYAQNGQVVFDIAPLIKGTYPISANTKYDIYTEQTRTSMTLIASLDNHTVDRLSSSSYPGFNTSVLYIFRTNSNFTPLSNARIYYYQVFFDDVLVRDFIPVLDYNGVACMYDKVSETFFYNSGTGTFGAGPIIAE